MYKKILSLCALGLAMASCSSSKENVLRVSATSVPHAEMLQHVKPALARQGIDLEIIIIDDYNVPNRALVDGDTDANFFQHTPFLEDQIAQFNYPISILTPIHIEPMGIYSDKIGNLSELEDNSIIAIPSDPSNEARALILLDRQGLIKLSDLSNLRATVADISSNPHNFQFHEVDAALLPRTLEDVDIAVINTNFAIQANLSPLKDALALEDKNSPYVNVIVVRTEDLNTPRLLALKHAMTTQEMRAWILKKYQGAIIPVF